jgi:hypothetical protein
MAGTIKHRFVNPVADAGSATETGPNEWNDSEVVAGGADGDAMVRRTAEPDGWRLEKRGSPLAQVNVTPAGNVGAGETTLHSHTIPASHLDAAGKNVALEGGGSFAANGTAKLLEFKFGAVADYVLNPVTGSPNALDWRYSIEVFRTGASTQRLHIRCWVGLIEQINDSLTATETDTASIVCLIKATGGVNNDIIQDWSKTRYEN